MRTHAHMPASMSIFTLPVCIGRSIANHFVSRKRKEMQNSSRVAMLVMSARELLSGVSCLVHLRTGLQQRDARTAAALCNHGWVVRRRLCQ